MRNKEKPKIRKIIEATSGLPYFSFEDLSPVATDKVYLKKVFYRYAKAGRLIRLKKGVYVTREKIQEMKIRGNFSFYGEFLANNLHQPSYLSLETILYYNNLLTEMPVSFTSITANKTKTFSNKFGKFLYHKIREPLFCGFEVTKKFDFVILKASKAKALFDFLYLRKNILPNKEAVKALRLNIGFMKKSDRKEFEKYIKLEGSKKMREIFNHLFH